ncbi:MAG TPA: VOC family protein [Candidatus Baltobacteraceae bacterium]|jgi:catechol 2,3-dioxygenase-like lactoylglutathione lyase family enzyme|nr:VOC family protein [Candidatus Baltobacteraceae bacterium]
MKISLGAVGHFGLAVRDVARAEAFWTKNFDLHEIFRFPDGVGLSNENVTIVLSRGEPHPETIDHMSFHLTGMDELDAALEQLKKNGVDLEDPGDEIGPEALGSPHYGLWFHDPDGYRWELSVQNARSR